MKLYAKSAITVEGQKYAAGDLLASIDTSIPRGNLATLLSRTDLATEQSLPEPEPEPESKAKAKPEPKAKAKPEPKAKAEPKPKAKAKPEPNAETVPEGDEADLAAAETDSVSAETDADEIETVAEEEALDGEDPIEIVVEHEESVNWFLGQEINTIDELRAWAESGGDFEDAPKIGKVGAKNLAKAIGLGD